MNVLAPSTLPPIPERVATGATVLDRERPGWATQVDPQQVHVDPSSTLVSLARRLLGYGYDGPLHTQKVRNGICLSLLDFHDPAHDPRVDLLDAWRHEITRRQHTNGGGGRR